ncbi:hypothetical protein MKX08_005510 [Trichoderma sp. CBMAI-0020]|nr:hypothetical protein MKX08_005510 [Trichoderma sp. CBMAI-0020]
MPMLHHCMCPSILQSPSFCPPPRFCIIVIPVPVAILPKQTLSDIRPGIQHAGPPRSEAGLLDTPGAQTESSLGYRLGYPSRPLPTTYSIRGTDTQIFAAPCPLQNPDHAQTLRCQLDNAKAPSAVLSSSYDSLAIPISPVRRWPEDPYKCYPSPCHLSTHVFGKKWQSTAEPRLDQASHSPKTQ